MDMSHTTSSIPPKTELHPAISGHAVSYLADCPRTPHPILHTYSDHPHLTIQTATGGAIVFNDLTVLVYKTPNIIYPYPLLAPPNFARSNIETIIEKVLWLPEADLDPSQPCAALTIGLTPSWRPLEYIPSPTEIDILETYTHALLYALMPTYPHIETLNTRWLTQPITPLKKLAPHKIKFYPTSPTLDITKKLSLMAARATNIINKTYFALPSLPGQSLRDGRQSRLPVTTITPPQAKTAHDKINLETNSLLPLIRAHL